MTNRTLSDDESLQAVLDWLIAVEDAEERWGAVIRHTFDMVYNGQETGRYRWDQLMKTEKTHFGSLFEINAQRAFGFTGGNTLDFLIAGQEVDAKWSQLHGGWMLPPEVFGQIAMVGTADDEKARWSLGLIRVTPEVRRETSNRDKKSQLNSFGRQNIRWLWRDSPLPPNVLLQLDAETVSHIFDHRSGTERLHRLFRAAEGRLVHRTTVATVAQQLDAQKRVRENGGSRSALRPEGYLILSGVNHRHLARALGVPVPSLLEYVSVRVVPDLLGNGALIGGRHWRRALPDEVCVAEAPVLPDRGVRD